jgi:hypothetical protein
MVDRLTNRKHAKMKRPGQQGKQKGESGHVIPPIQPTQELMPAGLHCGLPRNLQDIADYGRTVRRPGRNEERAA